MDIKTNLVTSPVGAGDILATVLASIGVHPTERCRCKQRQAWMNRRLSLSPEVKGEETTNARVDA